MKQTGPKLAVELGRLFAEMMGTFALTLVAAGSEVIGGLSGEVSPAARAMAPGLVVMVLIYAIGNASGAHFNPAVTFGFALRGDFPWKSAPGYWMAQILGALLAALLLRILFGGIKDLGATKPHYGAVPALVMEIVLTWLLVVVILGTATRYELIGPDAALAVGATIALCGLFAAPVSGASMNPARSLGPAVVAGSWAEIWIYMVGPLIGAALAVGTTWVLHRHKPGSEKKAARGDAEN